MCKKFAYNRICKNIAQFIKNRVKLIKHLLKLIYHDRENIYFHINPSPSNT